MIRFFTNYSYGGYEELYLGPLDGEGDYRYYLPLLPVKIARLKEDPSNEKLQKDVDRLSSYPTILRNGATAEASLPEGAFTLISNPGYKVIYRHLDDYFVVVVSDIIGNDHDEMGGGSRLNPFTMLFVGEETDAPLLDVLAWKMLKDEHKMKDFLGTLFSYDAEANGLRFSLKEMREKMHSFEGTTIKGLNHNVDVPFIILSQGFQLDYTLKVQKLTTASLGSVYDSNGKSLKGETLNVAIAEHTSVESVTSTPSDLLLNGEWSEDILDENSPDRQKSDVKKENDITIEIPGGQNTDKSGNLDQNRHKHELDEGKYRQQVAELELKLKIQQKKCIQLAVIVAIIAFVLGLITG